MFRSCRHNREMVNVYVFTKKKPMVLNHPLWVNQPCSMAMLNSKLQQSLRLPEGIYPLLAQDYPIMIPLLWISRIFPCKPCSCGVPHDYGTPLFTKNCSEIGVMRLSWTCRHVPQPWGAEATEAAAGKPEARPPARSKYGSCMVIFFNLSIYLPIHLLTYLLIYVSIY